MKRRRLIICLFLIAAVALLGIGYSAITTRLDIRGSVSSQASTNDFDVEFVDAELGTSLADTGISCAPSYDSTTGVDATLNISGLSNNGQTVVAYFKVQNNSKAITTLNATLQDLTIVITKDDVAVTSDTNPAANVFKGNYLQVEAVFDARLSAEEEKQATGTVATGGLTATVNTKTANDALDAQYVWVKVTVTVIGSFTAETTHGINIHFNAVSQ